MTWEFYKPQVVMVDEIQQEKYYQNIFRKDRFSKSFEGCHHPGATTSTTLMNIIRFRGGECLR
jgi:hypothetical protein